MGNAMFEVVADGAVLWRHTAGERGAAVAPPVFEIDGKAQRAVLRDVHEVGAPRVLSNGVREEVFEGRLAANDDVELRIVFRSADFDPVVRFKYVLSSRRGRRLTKSGGRDAIEYLTLNWAEMQATQEVRLSEFKEAVHSSCLSENRLDERDFAGAVDAMGPILVGSGGGRTVLVAYEHGSQAPDAFLTFRLGEDRSIRLAAVKGNYAAGTVFSDERPWESVWFELAAIDGGVDAMARAYRRFVLEHLSQNRESRRPYIFYNTWNFQSRNRWWNGRGLLDSINQQRIEAEIDAAHRMGIDVFVIDVGWYQKTGDWEVDLRRFPDGLASIKRKLDGYDMKLGLWFDNAAAMTSRIRTEHQDCMMSWRGKANDPAPVWESEPAQRMCLASRYWKAFADELIRLHREVGVTYFKWDAIHQYGCDDPRHNHGTAENSPDERADCYAFELGRAMIRIVDRLCEACPDAIMDFDITEPQRFVGLGFLAAGKYFLMNNGPYYRNYDIPHDAKAWGCVYLRPGPARAWVCREPLGFDKWIPSVLFLTHYLPDDPARSQEINLASLVLGQNGIWGDLPGVSEEGVARIRQTLDLYKQVRDDVTRAWPVRRGYTGGSPEIHEKIDESTRRGLVAVFTAAAGRYTYVTANRVAESWVLPEGTSARRDEQGRAVIEFNFQHPGARVVFFGVR